MGSVEDRVKDIVAEHLGIELSDVTMKSSFIDDLGADSLDTVELIMSFEKEFNIEIDQDGVERMTTVGETIKFLKNRVL